MNELRDWLKEGDPVASELPLSDVDRRRMRQAIVAASDSRQSPFADWARGSWAAATVVVGLTIAMGMTRWYTPAPGVLPAHVEAPAVTAPEHTTRRQVQLIAPGGTRVIWIFNPDFKP
jgi:hypothetical protein